MIFKIFKTSVIITFLSVIPLHAQEKEANSFYFTINNSFSFSGNDGSLDYSNPNWSIQGEWKLGYNNRKGYEAETRAGRLWAGSRLFTYVGADWTYRKGSAGDRNLFGQKTDSDRMLVGTLGMRYKFRFPLIADARVDTDKHVRLQLESSNIALSDSFRLSCMANTDKEYDIKLSYMLLQDMAIFINYDSDLKLGAGISIIY